ncbi:hypothetical protein LCGC14_3165480 [marine sediment metagenome]|uniref:Uncharacterized protein n=1 Tax=marine sediment metagenome TaxID=412755 RepID=A0A0F8VM91_9ZZZZ
MSRLLSQIEDNPEYKVIFTDLFDTLIHRNVHPNYTLKLWGKFMIRELGLSIEVDQLFSIRAEALSFVSKQQNLKKVEVAYISVVEEVYKRLVNSDMISGIPLSRFENVFERADFVVETSVQFYCTRRFQATIWLRSH